MPPSPSESSSPSNSGLYLVPYWVRGGRLWGVIALVLVLGGLVLPMVLSSVRRQASSRGFGRGVATSLCSLVHPSTDLSRADALALVRLGDGEQRVDHAGEDRRLGFPTLLRDHCRAVQGTGRVSGN